VDKNASASPEKTEKKDTKKEGSKLIIVTIDGVLVGFMVDSLDRVFSIDSAQIQAPEKIAESGIDRSLINGVARMDDSIYLILDIKKLLDMEEKTFIQKEILE
jgi:purine-binding chemotaxis protein CheW